MQPLDNRKRFTVEDKQRNAAFAEKWVQAQWVLGYCAQMHSCSEGCGEDLGLPRIDSVYPI